MSDDELTFVQRCALLILMAEAREVPNAYLTNVRKFDLKTSDRKALVGHGLISERQERKGRPVSMELTEKGWRRAVAELGHGVPARAGSGGAALYAVLAKLKQFGDRSSISLQDIFFSVPADAGVSEPEDIEARVRKAYGELAPRAGAWITLARLRAALADVRRTDLDATLVRLIQAPGVQLIPESNQKALTAEERAAAVRVGNQDRHLISIGS